MHRILLVRFSSIGDLLLTTPLLRALRAKHPDANITMVVREDLAETLRSNPRLTNLITWRRGTPLSDLAKKLREEDWTHRLDLHCSLRSRHLRQLVGGTWSGYPKHRIRRALLIQSNGKLGGNLGFAAERYFSAAKGLNVAPDGGPLEFFTTGQNDTIADALIQQYHLGQKRELVVLAPGAAHFTKRWPPEYWVALAKRLSGSFDLVVVGGSAEREVGDAIVAAARPAAASAAGVFSLSETAALLKRAHAIISGDTGVLHLATAVGTPAVALYGPTIEAFGFFPYHARAVVLQRDLYCRPCSAQGGPQCPEGHHRCLREILPEEVETSLLALLR